MPHKTRKDKARPDRVGLREVCTGRAGSLQYQGALDGERGTPANGPVFEVALTNVLRCV